MIIYDAWPQARRATQSHTMTISQPHHCRFSSDRSRIVCLSSTMSSRTKVATTGHVYQRRIPPALEGGFLSCFLSGTTLLVLLVMLYYLMKLGLTVVAKSKANAPRQ